MILMGMRKKPACDQGLFSLRLFAKKGIKPILFAGGEIPAIEDEKAIILQMKNIAHSAVNKFLIKLQLIKLSFHFQSPLFRFFHSIITPDKRKEIL